MSSEFDALRLRLEKTIEDEHGTALDAWLYNGLTAFALALNAAIAVLASFEWAKSNLWLAAVLAAVAGFIVALERSLGFGSRWRFHVEMKNIYQAIIDMIDFYMVIPEAEREKYRRDIFDALYAARKREGGLPNAGPAATGS